jgi:hypothetical protein
MKNARFIATAVIVAVVGSGAGLAACSSSGPSGSSTPPAAAAPASSSAASGQFILEAAYQDGETDYAVATSAAGISALQTFMSPNSTLGIIGGTLSQVSSLPSGETASVPATGPDPDGIKFYGADSTGFADSDMLQLMGGVAATEQGYN